MPFKGRALASYQQVRLLALWPAWMAPASLKSSWLHFSHVASLASSSAMRPLGDGTWWGGCSLQGLTDPAIWVHVTLGCEAHIVNEHFVKSVCGRERLAVGDHHIGQHIGSPSSLQYFI